jgi:hypothetical protein
MGASPNYCQLYFLEPEQAADIRLEKFPSLQLLSGLLSDLDSLLRAQNPFYQLFYQTRTLLEGNPSLGCVRLTPQLQLVTRQADDQRRYNLPAVNHELAGFIPDILYEYGKASYRDILLYL